MNFSEKPIKPVCNCDICFDEVDSSKVFKCGNDNCSLNICSDCGKQHRITDSRCPQCRQEIKHNKFDTNIIVYKPLPTLVEGLVVNSVNCCCFTIYELESPNSNNSIYSCCDNKCNILLSNREKQYYGGCINCSCNLCCLVSAALIPKLLGYYICSYTYACSHPLYHSITYCGGGRDVCACGYALGCLIQGVSIICCCQFCKKHEFDYDCNSLSWIGNCQNIATCLGVSCGVFSMCCPIISCYECFGQHITSMICCEDNRADKYKIEKIICCSQPESQQITRS